jgi:hypothetical protein
VGGGGGYRAILDKVTKRETLSLSGKAVQPIQSLQWILSKTIQLISLHFKENKFKYLVKQHQ